MLARGEEEEEDIRGVGRRPNSPAEKPWLFISVQCLPRYLLLNHCISPHFAVLTAVKDFFLKLNRCGLVCFALDMCFNTFVYMLLWDDSVCDLQCPAVLWPHYLEFCFTRDVKELSVIIAFVDLVALSAAYILCSCHLSLPICWCV